MKTSERIEAFRIISAESSCWSNGDGLPLPPARPPQTPPSPLHPAVETLAESPFMKNAFVKKPRNGWACCWTQHAPLPEPEEDEDEEEELYVDAQGRVQKRRKKPLPPPPTFAPGWS